jgi:hypothetical protein
LRRAGVTAPTPDEPNDSTGSVVVIRLRSRIYQLDADAFTQWQVREVAADVAAITGEPFSQVVTDVIAAYLRALDEQPREAAA